MNSYDCSVEHDRKAHDGRSKKTPALFVGERTDDFENRS